MAWTDNTIMFWWDKDKVPAGYVKVSDHSRGPVTVDNERIENRQRMVNGTMRTYVVADKRTWSTSWDMIPSTNTDATGLRTADGGLAGKDMETFHRNNMGAFNMQLRDGKGNIETVLVMMTEFSKEVVKRGPKTDLWNVSVTLEEV